MNIRLPRSLTLLTGRELEAALALKRREGRYTVSEASLFLEDALDGERVKLSVAVWLGELPYYMRGEMQERRNQGNSIDDWKDWPIYDEHVELYPDDLNNWLAVRHERIPYRFSDPRKPDGLETEAAPVATDSATDGVEPAKTGPGWKLKTSINRAPGYRWPLYQFLKAEYIAGRPCPKARDFLEKLKKEPNPDLEVMPDGLKYNDGVGNRKEANLKAIQQAIKGLTIASRVTAD